MTEQSQEAGVRGGTAIIGFFHHSRRRRIHDETRHTGSNSRATAPVAGYRRGATLPVA